MADRKLDDSIHALSAELETPLIALRRELHRNPEPSRQEHHTTARIAEMLEAEGIAVTRWDDCTGLIAEIRGAEAGPLIAMRSELDGVGVDDEKTVPWASQVPHLMHGCGHDLHVSILAGVAIICHRVREHLHGGVRFIFQPAEEVVPGGSLDMIQRHAMEGVTAILGFHSDPFLETGTVGLKKGPLTAGADIFEIDILGKSGHTARPHHSKDTILCAAIVINSLHQLVERQIDPREPFVLAIGQIQAGNAPNAIPARATMAGTVRMLSRETQIRMPGMIEQVVKGITESMGIGYEIHYHQGSPHVDNDGAMIDIVERVTTNGGGTGRTVAMEQSMGGEDFSWYLDHAPGAMVRLGVTKDGRGPGLHSTLFDVDERVIRFATDLFSRVVGDCLNGNGRSAA